MHQHNGRCCDPKITYTTWWLIWYSVMYSVLYMKCTVYLEMVWSCRNLLWRDFQCWFWFGMDVPSCVSDERFWRKGMANCLFFCFVLYILHTRYVERSFVLGLGPHVALWGVMTQCVEWCRAEILSSLKAIQPFHVLFTSSHWKCTNAFKYACSGF